MTSNNYCSYFKNKYKDQILIFENEESYIITEDDIEKTKEFDLPIINIGNEKFAVINKNAIISFMKTLISLKIGFIVVNTLLVNGEKLNILSPDNNV